MALTPDISADFTASAPEGLNEKGFARHIRPYLVLWAFLMLTFGLTVWVYLLSNLDKDRRQVESSALHDAEILSRSYASHLLRSIEAIDQLTIYVRFGWKASGKDFNLSEIRGNSGFGESRLYVSLVSREGDILTSTLNLREPLNVMEEPYFLAQQNSHDDTLYIGSPRYGQVSHRVVVHFSRKLFDRDGKFAGIVLVSVAPEYFIAGYDQVTLGKNGLLAILDTAGMVRITRIGEQVYDPQQPAVLLRLPVKGNSGTMMLAGRPYFVDGRNRFFGWQATGRYAMMTAAGIDEKDVLAGYFRKRRDTIHNSVVLSLIVCALSLTATFFYGRLSWRRAQLKQLQLTYRTATERGTDGFFIIHPEMDDKDRIADFRVVDCNEQGARLLRHRREELIGASIFAVFDFMHAEQVAELLRSAYVKRHIEKELNVSAVGTVAASWLELAINRPDGDLAVTIRDISASKAHVEELEKIGSEDALTGLPNRHWLKQHLPKAIASAQTSGKMLALLFIDLDGFKTVNDTMGHEVGDELLRNAGRRLKDAIRPHDIVVRIGGDEFIVLTENMANKSDAAQVAERILHSFRTPFRLSQGKHAVGTSIGISVYPHDGADGDTLLNHADMAMYAVKTRGKKDYQYFDPRFSAAVQEKHQNEADLRHALEKNQFTVYYQPRIDLATGRMTSMEALVRWAHPERGIVEPLSFIPLAEETGLIVQLGAQVIDMVCAQLAHWLRNGRDVVPVSINVSADQFANANIKTTLTAALERYRIPPRLVELEVTETSMLKNSADVVDVLATIQHLGVKLLVDDFGTGYSSLAQLQELDFDTLKVDKAFTSRLEKTDAGKVFYAAIITMAHSLGMRVVAEGVETAEQVRSLRDLNCDEIQGYFVARPRPPSDEQAAIIEAVH